MLAFAWAIAFIGAVGVVIAYALYTSGVITFSQPTQIVLPPSWITVGGTLAGVALGSVGAYFVTLWHDDRRRKQEAADVATTLYLELADRAARCSYDFDAPWKEYLQGKGTARKIHDVVKFRPTDPVMYPSLGIKLALLPGHSRGEVVRFFSAQDRWRRELDDLDREKDVDRDGCVRLARRLGESVAHAYLALDALASEVPDWKGIEQQAFEGIYSTSGQSDPRRQRLGRDTLRSTLEDLDSIVEADKDAR